MFHPHEHVLERLNAYLDRTLARVDATAVKEHCARCPSCRAALDRLTADRRTDPWKDERAGSVEGAGPRPAHAFSRRPRPGSQIFVFLGLTVAVAGVILAGFHVHFATLKPSPYDLRILGQTEWLPDTEAALHLRLLGQDGGGDNGSAGGSGRPLRGVPITMELSGAAPGQRLQLASVTTSDHGAAAPRVHLPDWPDGEYTLRVTANTGRTPEVLTRTVALKRSWRLMVSADKPVYQPGQVIRARGLALRRPDLKPVAGQEMVFSVTDPRGNVIFRHRGATSRFGIGSADCPLAGELIEGNYQVECRVGATTGRADGRGQILRLAPVQGDARAGSAVVSARPAREGAGASRLRFRQAGHGRHRDGCRRDDRNRAGQASHG